VACLPFEDKARLHFHRFMAAVHFDLKTLANRPNPLDAVADRWATQTRIICFDELVVNDIADAMLLGNLFAALFERGVTLAATSNIRPQDLYRDGLQRQQFLPAIKLIETHTEVLHIDGQRDYRLRVLDRAIRYRKHADGVLWCDFSELCDGPRSQEDYIELSKCYQTILVSNVPQFDATLENQARRFIALVDELYDRRVKVILSVAVPLDRLHAAGTSGSVTSKRLQREFERTRSRLQEMQSYEYLASAHRP
jgi:cell division protein ZapE